MSWKCLLTWLAIGASTSSGGCAGTPTGSASPALAASPGSLAPKQALVVLVDDVDALDNDANLDQAALAKLLEDMARGLEPISHAGHLRLHDVARVLAGSPASALSHAGLLKQGLQLVLKALVPFPIQPTHRTDYRRALQALSLSTDAVQELVPLAEQRAATMAALQSAVDAIFLARGGEPPFGEAERVELPAAPLGPLDVELEQARAEISKLAQAPSMSSGPAAAQALASLADVLAAADTSKRHQAPLAEARFEAERLKRGSETLKFGQAGWVRAGLISLLDGLDALQHGSANAPSAGSRLARRAAVAIDERSSLVFQRPAIQDAFRATVDAFTDLAGRDTVCPQAQ